MKKYCEVLCASRYFFLVVFTLHYDIIAKVKIFLNREAYGGSDGITYKCVKVERIWSQ